MSKIIGQQLTMPLSHPQPLISLLYEEVFDRYDPEAEIDVVLAFNDVERDDDGLPKTIEVVDFQVMRVDHELIGVAEGTDIGVDYLKSVDDWGRNVEGANSYWFMHKHAEGPDHHFPSEKDEVTASVLSSIDYARGTVEEDGNMRRVFNLMAILNRDESTALRPDDFPQPIADREIDLGITRQMATRIIKTFNLGPDHRIHSLFEELLAALGVVFDDMEDDVEPSTSMEHLRHALDLVAELMQIGRDLKREARGRGASSGIGLGDLMDALSSDNPAAALDELFGHPDAGFVAEIPLPRGGSIEAEKVRRAKSEDDFPILGRPQIIPSQPVAAEPLTAPETETTEETERPDVPDPFQDLDIEWLT